MRSAKRELYFFFLSITHGSQSLFSLFFSFLFCSYAKHEFILCSLEMIKNRKKNRGTNQVLVGCYPIEQTSFTK